MGYKTGKTSVTLLAVIMMTLTLGVVTVYADEDPALQQETRDEADFDLSSDAIEADGAAGDEVNNGTYKGFVNADGTVTVTGLVDSPADDPVYWGIIPSFIDGKAVTAIGDDAFNGVLSQLIIPDSVKTIGDRAFCGNGLVEPLKLPENLVSIGDRAFEGNQFTGRLTIPNGVTKIGDGAFCDNGFTGDLVLPASVTKIGDEAFASCSGFDGRLLIRGDGVEIGNGAFYGCSGFSGTLNIPNSVTGIGDHAFGDCSGFVGSLTIRGDMAQIGKEAFKGCSGFAGDLTMLGTFTEVGDSAFEGCGFAGDLTIPDGITSIGKSAFCGNTFSGDLTIPNTVSVIGDEAFNGCDGFNGTLTVPKSLKKSGVWAFSRLYKIDKIVNESGLELDPFDFYDGLETVFINDKKEIMSDLMGKGVYTRVAYIPVTDVAVSPTEKTIPVGTTAILTAKIAPANALDQRVRWESADPQVATVDQNGVVTGVAQGSTSIYVETDDGGLWAQCNVTVTVPVKSVSLNKTKVSIVKGEQIILDYTIKPLDATDQAVIWKSSNKKVAAVDDYGIITGVGKGTATITVTTADGAKKAKCKITVKVPVESVKINKAKASVKKGNTLKLKATIKPKDASNKSVTWKSSKPKIASVDKNGKVKGKKKGTAVITVTTKDGKKKATCKITVK
ncbi:MAG: Ig-like domain-containing protein [Lachnospiraceae bacterium]|nr:Ig-like domain-containing protein [Lachnospiraceae bacterium]